jgi:RNA polymerase sigma factor (sigma-70 family)
MAGKNKRLVPVERRIPDDTATVNSALLVARWKKGDQDAAREIFDRYLDRLTALARVRLSAKLASRMDADDVVMSAYRSFFVGARDGEFKLHRKGDLWRLLVEITLHKLYRAAARHKALRRTTAMEQSLDAQSFGAATPISREPRPEEVAAVADELEAVLAELPELGRRVLELRLRGHGVREIACELRCSEKTVRRWLTVAREAFQARESGQADPATLPGRSRRQATPVPRCRPAVRSQPLKMRRSPRSRLNYSNYVLRRMIGAGASGKVYIATCRGTGQQVAVKFLRKSFARDTTAIARFLAEAEVVSRLKHRGIIRVHGIGADRRSGHFIVMDFASGGDLAQRLRSGPVPVSDAVRWTTEAAEAIAHAHRHGIIHCDLKPSNLLLNGNGDVIVTDFGLARRKSEGVGLRSVIAGTPAFMAPEQVTEVWGTVGPWTDVYGIGAVLYMLLTDQPPVSGQRTADIFARIVSGQPVTSPELLREGIPEDIVRICMQCLCKRSTDRFDDATLLELLKRCAAELSKSR